MSTILPWALSVLETTPEYWLRLAQHIPVELLGRPAADGEWSAVKCLNHLVAAEAVFAYRLEVFASGQPSFPGYDPDAPENQYDPYVSPIELANEFASRRSASLKSLRGLSETDLQRTARHTELGMVSLDEMIHHWAAHDLNHTIQAERAVMQPFLAGCGIWIESYSDHIMKENHE